MGTGFLSAAQEPGVGVQVPSIGLSIGLMMIKKSISANENQMIILLISYLEHFLHIFRNISIKSVTENDLPILQLRGRRND
jgi:hypothetical protein